MTSDPELPSDNHVLISYPCYLLAKLPHPASPEEVIGSLDPLTAYLPEGRFIAAFTDIEAATQFIADHHQVDGHAPFLIDYPKTMAVISVILSNRIKQEVGAAIDPRKGFHGFLVAHEHLASLLRSDS